MNAYDLAVNTIRSAANAVNPHGKFDHGRHVDLSQGFTGPFPVIFLYPFTSTDPNDRDFLYLHPVVIGFWMQDAPSSSTEEREKIISKMCDLKNLFMAKVKEDQMLGIDNVRSEPQYQQHQGTVSGYAVSFNLRNFLPCE